MSSFTSWQNSQFASNAARTRGLTFPSPFLDYEKYYIPQTIKELFDYLGFAYVSDSNVKPAIESMAAYPITELIYHMPSESNKDSLEHYKTKWTNLLEKKLDIRVFNITVGLDYHVYGNAFVSVYKPFKRFLICKNCKNHDRISSYEITSKDTKWKWQNLKFTVLCTKCKTMQEALIKDEVKENAFNEISLVRWNPYHISIKKNPITGKTTFFYDIPQDVRKAIIKGDKDYLIYVQEEIITAVQEKAKGKGSLQIEFGADLIFAMQRPMASLPGSGTHGWGLPNGTASLRDLSMKNSMRRAQTMVMHEHTIPFRVFSPQLVEQPSTMLKGSSWKKEVEFNYKNWLNNPNHIMTSPIPINVQQIGGDRGALTLFPELQVTNTDIIKGFGVPREFVEGGLTYSGSNVSIRMLENLLLDYVHRSESMINWVIGKIAEISDLLKVEAKYQPFKMADDIQLKQLLLSLRQTKDISQDLIGQYFDFNAKEQRKLVAQEDMDILIHQAKAQASSGVTLQKIQEYMANTVPTSMGNYQNPIPPDLVSGLVQQIQGMPPEQIPQILEGLNKQDPNVGRNVSAQLDLTPAAATQDIMKILSTPEAQKENALQDMSVHEPTRALLMKLVAPNLFAPQVAPGKSGLDIKQNPNQRPPRSATPGI